MIQPLLVFSDFGILALRIVLGLILIIHGWPKIKNIKGTAEWMGQMFKPGIFWAAVVSFIEVFGGLFLIAGLLTQIIAFIVALEFLVIVLKVKRSKGFVGGYEFDLLIMISALLLMTLGGGVFSADEFFGILLY